VSSCGHDEQCGLSLTKSSTDRVAVSHGGGAPVHLGGRC
jgi:hypothetical protein